MPVVGVLAVQGGFAAHAAVLANLGADIREVRVPSDLDGVDGLVLPGGESTVQLKLIAKEGLAPALDSMVRSGRPVLATCAGLILASRSVNDPVQPGFGWINVSVSRNAWGRQIASFEATSDDGSLPLVFIRAPRITSVGPGVQILATLDSEPILVRENNVWGATFHPELTSNATLHRRVFGLSDRYVDEWLLVSSA